LPYTKLFGAKAMIVLSFLESQTMKEDNMPDAVIIKQAEKNSRSDLHN